MSKPQYFGGVSLKETGVSTAVTRTDRKGRQNNTKEEALRPFRQSPPRMITPHHSRYNLFGDYL